jgi:hypothetical protein
MRHRRYADAVAIVDLAQLAQFGAHAALFGVNPWRLQAWMGTSASMKRCST